MPSRHRQDVQKSHDPRRRQHDECCRVDATRIRRRGRRYTVYQFSICCTILCRLGCFCMWIRSGDAAEGTRLRIPLCYFLRLDHLWRTSAFSLFLFFFLLLCPQLTAKTVQLPYSKLFSTSSKRHSLPCNFSLVHRQQDTTFQSCSPAKHEPTSQQPTPPIGHATKRAQQGNLTATTTHTHTPDDN